MPIIQTYLRKNIIFRINNFKIDDFKSIFLILVLYEAILDMGSTEDDAATNNSQDNVQSENAKNNKNIDIFVVLNNNKDLLSKIVPDFLDKGIVLLLAPFRKISHYFNRWQKYSFKFWILNI